MVNQPKKGLIFSLVYYPRFVGGAEVTIKEVTDRIDPMQVEFDMITLRFDKDLPVYERVGNINVHRVGPGFARKTIPSSMPLGMHLIKYLYPIIAYRKALKLHRAEKYDFIWSLMVSYNTFAAVFFKLMRPTVPFVFTLQDGDPIPHIKRRALPLYPFFKKMFTRADHIQAISQYLADWAHDMGATCPVDVVPNAVDYKLFTKEVPQATRDVLTKKINKKDGDVFLITTSRLVEKNGVTDIIDSLIYLPSNVKLLILGDGPLEPELKAQAMRLGLNYTEEPPVNPGNRVRFMGYVAHADMPQYLAISDVFVRPSLSEGLGNSFLEAMAAGLPVIATKVGGIPDFLTDGETGLFCEVGNPRSIAQKVEKFLKDRESRDYIVKKARTMVRDRYQWDKIAQRMQGIFESVLD